MDAGGLPVVQAFEATGEEWSDEEDVYAVEVEAREIVFHLCGTPGCGLLDGHDRVCAAQQVEGTWKRKRPAKLDDDQDESSSSVACVAVRQARPGRGARGEREKEQAGAPWVMAPRWSSAAATAFMAAMCSAALAHKCSAAVFWASLASNAQARAALDRAVAARASAVMKSLVSSIVDFHVRAATGASQEERLCQWERVARVARRAAR